MKWLVLALFAALMPAAAAAQQFGAAQHLIRDDDGDPIANFDLDKSLSARLAALKGVVKVGNPNGDVTLYQFYDLNCPFCREAAHDVDDLLKQDNKLTLIYVPYAVLSMQSLQGALVEIAASQELTPDRFRELHRRIYAERGTVDAQRVYDAAVALGADPKKLAAVSGTAETLATLKANADFGMAAKLRATPAYVIAEVAILGHPGLKPLQNVVAAVRRCGKAVC
jgi:protein-disulfide isomerase